MKTVQILDYSAEFQAHFKQLNLEWMQQFRTNTARQSILEDPKTHIIDKGGFIFFAEIDGKIVGTSALLRESHKIYEIADMAVTPQYQGKHIGKSLLQKSIDVLIDLGEAQSSGRTLALDRLLGLI